MRWNQPAGMGDSGYLVYFSVSGLSTENAKNFSPRQSTCKEATYRSANQKQSMFKIITALQFSLLDLNLSPMILAR